MTKVVDIDDQVSPLALVFEIRDKLDGLWVAAEDLKFSTDGAGISESEVDYNLLLEAIHNIKDQLEATQYFKARLISRVILG